MAYTCIHTHTSSTHIMAWVFLLSPKWGSHSLSIPGTQSYTEEHEGLPVKHFNHLASYKHSNLLLHQIPGLWKSFRGKPNLLQGGIQMVYTNMWTYQLCATCSIKKINWQNEKPGGREREAGQLVKWRTLVLRLSFGTQHTLSAAWDIRPHPICAFDTIVAQHLSTADITKCFTIK